MDLKRSHYRVVAVLFFILFISNTRLSGSIVINEFMSSNLSTHADEDGDFEDWIEIHNTGNLLVDISNYGLSDDDQDLFKWRFPACTIQPGQFIIIWASGKNRIGDVAMLHTNFSISSQGEDLLITAPDGTIQDWIVPVNLAQGVSYGRQPDGGNSWLFFAEPTPSASNTSKGFQEILDPPLFSQISGFYTASFNLSITTSQPGTQIIYTLDGSLPDENNLNGTFFYYKNSFPESPADTPGALLTSNYRSMLYSGTLNITDRSPLPDSLTHKSSTYDSEPYYFPIAPVFKGTVVRARTVKEGAIPSEVVTHVYFVHPNGRNRYSLPVINLSINAAHLFDYNDGIYTAGVDFDNWRKSHSEANANGISWANYHRRGDEWEYPAHFTFFEPSDAQQSFGTTIGIRMHGAWSRSFPMKTIRLFARSADDENMFNWKIFPDRPYNAYKRLMLRNSGNDYYYSKFRDAAIQRMMEPLNFDVQAYRPAIVFMNGEYWGIHNLRERTDKYYIERVYGVDPAKIDYLEWDAAVLEGDNSHYLETLNIFSQPDVSGEDVYQYLNTRIDIENYLDYQVANIFVSNLDWPANNIEYWRYQTTQYNPDAPPGQDGRWRWLSFDTDYGLGLYDNPPSVNTLAFATEPNSDHWGNLPWSTFLLRNMLRNHRFRDEFITRFSDLLNTVFLPSNFLSIIDEMKAVLEPYMREDILRWERPENMKEWYYHVDYMKNFVTERPAHQWSHLQSFFNLGEKSVVNLNVSAPGSGHIKINTIEINSSTPGVADNPYPWQGSYFQNTTVKLKAIPSKNYIFSHWSGDLYSQLPEISLPVNGDINVTAHFEYQPQPEVLHFWMFTTDIPNDTPLTEIASAYSAVTPKGILKFNSSYAGYPFNIGSPYWRKASMERRNLPTSLNYFPVSNIPYSEGVVRGIQIKQPFMVDGNVNELILSVPTTGFKNIKLVLAAINEQAAESVLIDYAVSASGEFVSAGDTPFRVSLTNQYSLIERDFSSIKEAENNPFFKIRIRFDGNNMTADLSNRVTINNISVSGVLTSGVIKPQLQTEQVLDLYPNPATTRQTLQLGEVTDVVLYDVMGNQISQHLQVNTLSLAGLESGIYIIRSKTGKTGRLVIMK